MSASSETTQPRSEGPPVAVTEQFSRLAVETRYEDLPQAALDSAKLRFLDAVACMLSGAKEPATVKSLELARHLGSAQVASVAGHPDKLSAPEAAFINAVAAHCLDYDDYTIGANHFSSIHVPAALAIGEEAGASGRQVLTAFVIGFQISTRLAWGLTPGLYRRGWQPNGPLGAPGVAAAAARILGLNVDQTRMAIGIATAQLAGARANFPSMTKALHIGHSARAGVYAAMLAQRGFTANPSMVEGSGGDHGHERYGLAETYVGRGNYDLDKMVLRLGEEWELAQNRTFPRLYPCGTTAAPAIDAMIDLSIGHDLKADQIDHVELEMTPQALGANSLGATNSFDARFSMPYSVSVALIDRKAGLAQYTDERVARDDVQTLLKRVKVWSPEDFQRHYGRWGQDGINPGLTRLAVFLKDGRVLREARSHARGWPDDPVTWDTMVAKCIECAEGVISPARRDEVVSMIADLDKLPKISDLLDALRT